MDQIFTFLFILDKHQIGIELNIFVSDKGMRKESVHGIIYS